MKDKISRTEIENKKIQLIVRRLEKTKKEISFEKAGFWEYWKFWESVFDKNSNKLPLKRLWNLSYTVRGLVLLNSFSFMFLVDPWFMILFHIYTYPFWIFSNYTPILPTIWIWYFSVLFCSSATLCSLPKSSNIIYTSIHLLFCALKVLVKHSSSLLFWLLHSKLFLIT